MVELVGQRYELDEVDVDWKERSIAPTANHRSSLASGSNPEGSVGTISGTSFEARFATAEEVDIDTIEQVEVPYTTTSGGPGDIDVLRTSDGRMVLVDTKHQVDPSPFEVGDQIDQYQNLRGTEIEALDEPIPDDAEIVFVSRYSREEFFEPSPDTPEFVKDEMNDLQERIESSEGISVVSIEEFE